MRYMEFGAGNRDVILLLHGGGLSWWNFRAAAEEMSAKYRVILPVLDGHAGSDAEFGSIEQNAARIIAWIDENCAGRVLAVGGVSLGAQVALEMLAQRGDVCRFALIESASVKPSVLTHALIGPAVGWSYPLIRQKWFAALQFAYLGLPKEWFDSYYRDTCRITKADMIAFMRASSAYALKDAAGNATARVLIVAGGRETRAVRRSAQDLHRLLPGSALEILPGYRHGEWSACHPQAYAQRLCAWIGEATEEFREE